MAMALNKSVQCRLPLFTLFFLLFFLQRVFSMCPQGYFINTNGGCSPECIFGKKCINGCSEPNVCDECDTSFNITKNCLRCAEGFVWNGAGNCMQIPYITQCTEFLKNNQKFTYKVTKDSNFEIKVSPQDVVFSETWCSKVVPIYQPFTYGVWLQFQTSDQEELMVSIFDKSCKESSHLFFSLQKSCVLDEACLSEEKSMCISNGTKHTFTITKDPIVVFVHSAIGESILSEFSLTISVEQNQCVPSPTTIAFNDNNITTLIVDPNTFVLSRTACLQDEANIKWFSLEGVDQRVLLNLCESTYADEIALQVIDFASSGKSFNDTLCAGLSANCLNYISGNCENTKYSKIVVNGGSKTPIYIGITIPNRVNYGLIKLHVEKICPENCGFHGTCNERVGKCFCEENYVLNDQICSLCGNGILDTTEDCDDSYLTDVHCDTHTCKCYSGYSPQLVGGRVRCIIDTCGNNRIDPNESCEGGVLCERCQCQNGSYPHHPIQYGCVPETCGNGQLDVNEECDGGEGCVECLCDKQLMYFANNNIDCKNTQDRNKLISSLTPTIGLYIFLYFVLLFVYYLRYNNLNAVITKAHKEKEMYNQIIMTGSIPFSKQNAQKITKLDNPFFKISAETLDFGEDKLELNQPYYFSFTLQNLFSKVLLFTFHGVDSHKYRLTFKPPTGAIFTNETIQVKATLVMLCTTKVTEKVKVTLKYGKNKKVNKEVSQEILRKCPEVVGGTFSSSHRLTISRSSRILKKSSTLPSKVSSFYVNLRLQTESVLSSRIDLDEIEIKQPPVGQGSFGLVYEGVWRGAEVAVKMLKSDMFDTETLLPSFMEECELMERIRSPFVLGFIGSVVMPDQLCLLTEFCPLFSLRKFMKTNSMSTQLKVRICQDIAKGMDYLHQNNIVHRDLKSDNVLMVSKNPNEPVCVKISDFGTSALFVDTKSAKKIVDIGTPMYMAPEVHDKSLGNASFKCDVFSFAICILEIWLTKSPYDPDVFATPASIQEFVMSGKRPLIPKVCVYRRIIRKCWQHKPRSRPTFAEISKELDVIYQKVFEGSRSQRTSCNIGVVTTDTDTDVLPLPTRENGKFLMENRDLTRSLKNEKETLKKSKKEKEKHSEKQKAEIVESKTTESRFETLRNMRLSTKLPFRKVKKISFDNILELSSEDYNNSENERDYSVVDIDSFETPRMSLCEKTPRDFNEVKLHRPSSSLPESQLSEMVNKKNEQQVKMEGIVEKNAMDETTVLGMTQTKSNETNEKSVEATNSSSGDEIIQMILEKSKTSRFIKPSRVSESENKSLPKIQQENVVPFKSLSGDGKATPVDTNHTLLSPKVCTKKSVVITKEIVKSKRKPRLGENIISVHDINTNEKPTNVLIAN